MQYSTTLAPLHILALPTLSQRCTVSVLQPFTFDNFSLEHPVVLQHFTRFTIDVSKPELIECRLGRPKDRNHEFFLEFVNVMAISYFS